MKKILPVLLSFLVGFSLFMAISPTYVSSQVSPAPELNVGQVENLNDKWIIDNEVTAIGKNASRSGLLLDWALKDYNWSFTTPGTQNPLLPFWVTLRNIVYAFLIAIVMISAIVMLVTRGKSLTIQRFIPRFIVIVVLVTLSFSIVQVLYELVDVIQGFFIRPGGVPISQRDLLFIGWNYEPFIGLRLLGDQNYESAFTTLLFVKLTTFTYYVMLGVLLVRKIILWFFIIISPLFPLLLFFYPLRNTAKIWLGEFFRWLLYAPLFAVFLAGVVSLWELGIPLSFNFDTTNTASAIIFPTAVSILLGGPGQAVGQLNSLNLVDTYAQYIVALMMLWAVIIVPWILLQIFLDYLSDVNMNSNPVLKQIAGVINKLPLNPPPGTPPPPPDNSGAGKARRIPLIKDFQIPTITNLARQIPTSSTVSVEQMTKLSVPTLRDIAVYESQSLSNSEKTKLEAERVRQTLTHIAQPAQIKNEKERNEFERIRETLRNQSLKGDKIASTILKASENYAQSSQVTNDTTTNLTTIVNQLQNPDSVKNEVDREKVVILKERIEKESKEGNPLASKLSQAVTPAVNSVNLTKALEQFVTPSKDIETFEKTEKLKEKIQQESKEGNSLATTILTTITSLTRQQKASETLERILQPQTVLNLSEREKYEQISQSITAEREKGNTFATLFTEKLQQLRQTSDVTEKDKILSEIYETVVKENDMNNPLAALILGQIGQLREETSDSQINILRDELTKAQEQGSPLADELMNLSQKEHLSDEEVHDIEKKVEEAKRNGDPLGVLLADLLQRKQLTETGGVRPQALPQTNRIQQVSLDDYEAVKKMWTENYEKLDVPEGEDRKKWVKDDVKQISETIDLLSSENAENVQQGMDKVSDILPFLLIGGFSQSEITAYLKAKMEAAKSILIQLEKQDEKETEVLVENKKAEVPKHLSQTVSVENSSEPVSPEASLHVELTPHITLTHPDVHNVVTISPTQANEAIVRMANITIPTLKTIAQLDKMQLDGEEKQNPDMLLIKDTLEGIADPKAVTQVEKKQYYQDIRSRLLSEKNAGNRLADSLLASAQLVSDKTLTKEIEEYIHLSNLLKKLSEHDVLYEQLAKRISFESVNGNELARTLEAAISNPQLFSDPLQLVSLTKEISERCQDDSLASELCKLSMTESPDMIKQQKLFSLQTLLKELSDPIFLPEEKQKEISRIKEQLETHQSIPSVKKLCELLTYTFESGVELPSILKLEKLLIEKRDEIKNVAPLIFTIYPEYRTPDSLMQALHSDQLAKEVEQNSSDPFVQQLREWSKNLSEGQRKTIEDILNGIYDPESVSENKRREYIALKQSLEKNVSHDTFSHALITLSQEFHSGFITDDGLSALLPTLIDRVIVESVSGNEGASMLASVIYQEFSSETDVLRFHKILLSLSDPSHVPIDKRGVMLSLRSLIQTEIAKGEPFARDISRAVTQVVKKEGDIDALSALWQKTIELQKKGNQVASALISFVNDQKETEYLFDLGEILRSLSQNPQENTESYSISALKKTLDDTAQKGDPNAMSILSAVEIIKKNGVDLSEVKKVSDIINRSQSTSYIQGFKLLCETSFLSFGTLRIIREILLGISQKDQGFGDLVSAIESMRDTELWELLHSSAKELTEFSDPMKTQEVAIKVRDKILSEDEKGNQVAHLFMQTILERKDKMKVRLFTKLLGSLANPSSIQLPEEKASVENLIRTLQQSQNDQFSKMIQSVIQVFSGNKKIDTDFDASSLIKEYIVSQSYSGNTLAKELVETYHLAPFSEEMVRLQIDKAAEKGNPVATMLRSLIAPQQLGRNEVVLPKENHIQQISLEDYESVKHMWTEGYKSLDVPGNMVREEWLEKEIQTISQTISLLSSQNANDQEEGAMRVSHILPFLLIGGFSSSEVASYLKAKLEAAKTVLNQLHEKDDEEETKIQNDHTQHTSAQKAQKRITT